MLALRSALSALTPAKSAPKISPDSLEGKWSFLPDEILPLLECCPLPQGLKALINEYVNHVFFGPQHWKMHWGATPVKLPTLEELRKRVAASGKPTQKPLETMSPEECANLVGELGVEEIPTPPKELRTMLNLPVRAKEGPIGYTCVVTYIPEYVRKEDKVMAVTFRTLALELGPKPKLGTKVQLVDAEYILKDLLTAKDSDGTQPSCYFVMERDVAPDTKGKKPSELMEQIKKQGDGNWEVPEARNFLAAVFSRCAWTGEFLFGDGDTVTYAYCNGKSQDGDGYTLVFGNFTAQGLQGKFDGGGDFDNGACGSRKLKA